MNRTNSRKIELVCVLCNDALADVEKACTGPKADNGSQSQSQMIGGLLTETDSGSTDVPEAKGVSQYYGGYQSMAPESHKDVVATKCGHMFHQGCLRKHVHKTLIEGKGGSLFCPICTRPFQMNRLWNVIIPSTKAQRERYIQMKMMKEDNVDMVKQLKIIRTQIGEEESRLRKLKEDVAQCLTDVQQKQKLLDSVNGPTNNEIAELTKVHMQRQEVLHVVTQHNADLLKLLAEESNISSTAAENIFGCPRKKFDLNYNHMADGNHNFLPSSAEIQSRVAPKFRTRGRGGEIGVCMIPSYPDVRAPGTKHSGKSSKRSQKVKAAKKKKKNKAAVPKEKDVPGRFSGYPEFDDFPMDITDMSTGVNQTRMPAPSKILSMEGIRAQKEIPQTFAGYRKPELGTPDTLVKWNLDSLKELLSLDSSISEVGRAREVHNQLVPRTPPPEFHHDEGDERQEERREPLVNGSVHNMISPTHMPFSRKLPILHETLENGFDRIKH